jgi:hypothetical protein
MADDELLQTHVVPPVAVDDDVFDGCHLPSLPEEASETANGSTSTDKEIRIKLVTDLVQCRTCFIQDVNQSRCVKESPNESTLCMNEALKDNDPLFVCNAMIYLGRIIGESMSRHIYRLKWGDRVACPTPNGYNIHLQRLPFSIEDTTDSFKIITGDNPGFFLGERIENATTFQSVSYPGRYLGGTAANGVYLKSKSTGPQPSEALTKDEDIKFTVRDKSCKSSASEVCHPEAINEGQDDVDSFTETNSTTVDDEVQLCRVLLFDCMRTKHRFHMGRTFSHVIHVKSFLPSFRDDVRSRIQRLVSAP